MRFTEPSKWDFFSHLFFYLVQSPSKNSMFLLWSLKSENGLRFNTNLSVIVAFSWKLNHSFTRSIGIKCFILVLISWQNNIKKLKLSTRKGSVVWRLSNVVCVVCTGRKHYKIGYVNQYTLISTPDYMQIPLVQGIASLSCLLNTVVNQSHFG